MYVSYTENAELATEEGVKINKKGGSTLSIRKKGWKSNYILAMKLAGWA